MFLKNCWYCAGWDFDLGLGKDDLLTRKIAGKTILLYRKPSGEPVAMQDRCPHRNAPLSLGRKEGDGIRCQYHGIVFGPDGKATEIPGMSKIPDSACAVTLPVVEKNNWVWVWMGDPEKADESLICDAYSLDDPNLKLKTHTIRVNTGYREEIANLADLSHVSWTHEATLGSGISNAETAEWSKIRSKVDIVERGINQKYVTRGARAPSFARHLFPDEARFDIVATVQMSVPCNFILHFEIFTAGDATEGDPNGQLILDTYSSQAVTPRDEDSVDYYFSWGTTLETYNPRIVDLMHNTNLVAFLEDKAILEGQHQREKEYPDAPSFNIVHDAAPGKLLWVLDKLIAEEQAAAQESTAVAAE